MNRALMTAIVWGRRRQRSGHWLSVGRWTPLHFAGALVALVVCGAVALALLVALVTAALALVLSGVFVAGALLVSGGLVVAVLGALGFGTLQLIRTVAPQFGSRAGMRDERRTGQAAWGTFGWTGMRSQGVFVAGTGGADGPVDVLRRRYASGEIGQTEFRARLVELLKERYVRGDLTLLEYESRVKHLYLDPALQPPS